MKLPVHANRTNFKHGDLFVPWTLKDPRAKSSSSSCPNGESTSEQQPVSESDDASCVVGKKDVHHRFYHVFARGELEELARSVPGLVVEQVYYEQGNWCLLFSKNA